MPTDIIEAMENLIGDNVTIITRCGNLTGTVASVTDDLVILCTNGGVVYLRPNHILGVSTGRNPTVDP